MNTNQLADLFEEFAQRLRGMAPVVAEPADKVSGSLLKTEKEMAEILGVSLSHIQRMRTARQIPHVPLGRLIRYNLKAVESALEKLTINEIAGRARR